MSRNSIGLISPRAQPQEQKEPKRDIWDDIMRGLQIANGITGIAADVTKIQDYKAQQGERDRFKAGKHTPEELVKMGGVLSDTASPGSMELENTATGKKVWRSDKPVEKPTISPGEQARLDLDREKLDFAKQQAATKDKAIGAAATAQKTKPATEAQLNSANFGKKALAANETILNLESSGYNPASLGREARDMPFIGKYTRSKEDRQYLQGQKEFIAAILRKESQGSITKNEFEEYAEIYFPTVGDDPDTIAQKADARQRAAQSLLETAGETAATQISDKSFKPKAGGVPSGTAIGSPANGSSNTPSLDAIEAELKRRKLKPQSNDDLAPIPQGTGF